MFGIALSPKDSIVRKKYKIEILSGDGYFLSSQTQQSCKLSVLISRKKALKFILKKLVKSVVTISVSAT